MDNLIKLSSITQSLSARDILKKHGIKSNVKRIPAKRGESTCGYGLYIYNNVDKAISILEDNNIKVSGRASGGAK